MLTMLTTEELAAWFGELPDAAAEEVATGLELIEQLGPERNPDASSDLLLWYESTSGSARTDTFYREEYVRIAERVRHIMTHLESREVRERLARAPIQRAQRASDALQQLRRRLRPALHLIHSPQAGMRELEQGYRRVLDALDLEEASPPPAGAALRELRLTNMRVLYGVDAPNRRALAVWGDTLDRNAYGPSVRRALALWREFSEGTTTLPVRSVR